LSREWFAGLGCFLILLFWEAVNIANRLEDIRDHIRGFSDDELLDTVTGKKARSDLPKKGTLSY
jgi:hypothetical protein